MICILEELHTLANPKVKLSSQNYAQEDDRNNFYWSPAWRAKRQFILRRDNFECQVCKSEGKVNVQHSLIVHHIKPLEYHPEVRLDDGNLITVCHTCHNSIHFGLPDESDEWW